jgi:hypothetical protein
LQKCARTVTVAARVFVAVNVLFVEAAVRARASAIAERRCFVSDRTLRALILPKIVAIWASFALGSYEIVDAGAVASRKTVAPNGLPCTTVAVGLVAHN